MTPHQRIMAMNVPQLRELKSILLNAPFGDYGPEVQTLAVATDDTTGRTARKGLLRKVNFALMKHTETAELAGHNDTCPNFIDGKCVECTRCIRHGRLGKKVCRKHM